MVGTMGVLIVFSIIMVIPVELFEGVRPYLFTHYINVWQKAFLDPIPWNEVLTSLGVLGLYSMCCVVTAWFIFLKKDILS
jgi:hypothetical protein